MGQTLPLKFFKSKKVTQVAKSLIGKKLYTNFDGIVTGGIITETEAYCGLTDQACHAHLNKKTKRTEIFYLAGGRSYVYLCYGIHYLFNIITGPINHPQAVLIRAVQPDKGLDKIRERRGLQVKPQNLANGPGKLCQALGISKEHNNLNLNKKNKIWLEMNRLSYQSKILSTPRIGIDYAGEDALLPWRYVLQE